MAVEQKKTKKELKAEKVALESEAEKGFEAVVEEEKVKVRKSKEKLIWTKELKDYLFYGDMFKWYKSKDPDGFVCYKTSVEIVLDSNNVGYSDEIRQTYLDKIKERHAEVIEEYAQYTSEDE